VNPDATPTGELPPHAGVNLARLSELAALFLKLGAISFGGPAAHTALMEAEVVGKRQWLTRQQFLDMLGAANLIPGPTSTEIAINVGFVRAGWAGLCVAGASFIAPAALITGAFAWAYVRFGASPQAASVLAGIKPAVLAVIAIAIWRLGKTAMRDVELAALGGLALAAFFFSLNPIVILLGGGLLGMMARQIASFRSQAALFSSTLMRQTLREKVSAATGSPWLRCFSWRPIAAVAAASSATGAVVMQPSLLRIALFFLRVGAVLYGGGYVLLAFLEEGLVHQHGWLTQQQLLDAVAIGQFTPGPVLSTATFIGYILGGAPGAAVATVSIFLPSFFYVALLAPVLFRLRRSPWMAAFLDSVNVCAVALMAAVTFRLALDALHGGLTWMIAGASLGVLLRWKLNPAWAVAGGGLAGLVVAAIR
jgi:chromate transporter